MQRFGNSTQERQMLNITQDNAAELVDAAIQHLSDKPTEEKSGRGVVIAAGGAKFQINAWVCIRMLRALGCEYPIECWYLGESEKNVAWEDIVRGYGVTCINAHTVREKFPHERLYGWELKPYAIMHSPFAEVLYLDADNIPVVDPSFLFETEQYKKTGTIFWPDFGRLERSRKAWKVFGNVPYRDEPEVESGQIVIDKLRHWKQLELCNWYMQNSNNFFFNYVHGDKEVFHLAWRKLDVPYSMPSRGIDALVGVMCQHDFQGRRIFQHRNMRKWTFYNNPDTEGFMYEQQCRDFIEELKRIWSPASQELATADDLADIYDLSSREYEYKRVGHDQRVVKFSPYGTFEYGGAGCEYYWTIRSGRLLIMGEDGKLTMDLEKNNKGEWFGKWLHHEKMPILLIPK